MHVQNNVCVTVLTRSNIETIKNNKIILSEKFCSIITNNIVKLHRANEFKHSMTA